MRPTAGCRGRSGTRTSSRDGSRESGVGTAVAIVLTLLGWSGFGRPPADHIQFGADQALLVRGALDVQQGAPVLLGAYSKSGVHHPGPFYQWVLAGVMSAGDNDVSQAVRLLSLVQWSTVGLMVLVVHAVTRSAAVAGGDVSVAETSGL